MLIHKADISKCPFFQRRTVQTESGSEAKPVCPEDVIDTVRRNQDSPVQALRELHRNYGDNFLLETSQGKFFFDHRPETARQILTQTEGRNPAFKKSEAQTRGLARVLGRDNVLLEDGQDWKSSRHIVASALSTSEVRNEKTLALVLQSFDRQYDSLEQALKKNGGSLEVDLSKVFRKATLDVALRKLFGQKPSDEQLDSLSQAYEVLHRSVGKEWLLPRSLTGVESPEPSVRQAQDSIDEFAHSLLQNSRSPEGDSPNYLQSLLCAQDPSTGEPYTQDKLLSEVKNLLLAAHETTANLLTWTVSDLARDRVKQNEIRREVEKATDGSAPTLESHKKTKGAFAAWRQQAVENPPNFLLAREASRDVLVGPEEDQDLVEAGTTILVSTAHANHEIDPAMLSFGGGKRFCPGISLARLETEVGVNRLLQRFEVFDSGPRGVISGLTQLPQDSLVTLSALP